ncbi:response regulator [Nocardioides okcheonensis]|uniref:response regulator n=1 Tax=Nocardioides okcheonensis TaxID=2894081 RepID=UPI001E476856|nr:response regulator [Nocardioides okcheonensis]UFN43418.1 response regulator [Nocardioides okcheonensis]
MTRILVTDDDDDIREFVSFVLARAGHDVSTARDGAEAIAFLTAEHFDLLVVDQHMPHATGAEVLLALRQRDPRTKALLMSGDHDMQSDAEVAEVQPHFLRKPFNLTSLMAAVNALVGDDTVPSSVVPA